MKKEKQYCNSLTSFEKLQTKEVKIGNVLVGGDNPIRIQSMANTDTLATKESVEQSIRIIKAGGEFVRFTTQGLKEANNLKEIKEQLSQFGYDNPLIADIHFNPKVAFKAAEIVEKIRINPGNFADRNTGNSEWTETEYAESLKKLKETFTSLIKLCILNNTAIRIGVNHGSLSERIMSRYGDTPEGMVESALEFLQICKYHEFHNVVLSMKSSNTRVMIQANRLLVKRMSEIGAIYPVHLGVTEAGEGEDGRIKSAVGIGAMLADGIGDTIRVSLTEPPENEIPVAQKLVNYFSQRNVHDPIPEIDTIPINPFDYATRKTSSVEQIGGKNVPVVIVDQSTNTSPLSFNEQQKPDFIYLGNTNQNNNPSNIATITDYVHWKDNQIDNNFPLFDSLHQYKNADIKSSKLNFVKINIGDTFKELKGLEQVVFVLSTNNLNGYAEQRRAFFELINKQIQNPVIIQRNYTEDILEDLQLKSASDIGPLLIDGLGNGIMITNKGIVASEHINATSFGILQASRVRMSKTEFISCPGCGRTLFNLEDTTAHIKNHTSHLKNLKIGIMGCIVNGPGEMADADYGYVGAGPGKIHLYKSKELVRKNIPEEQALESLIELIKENGDWVER